MFNNIALSESQRNLSVEVRNIRDNGIAPKVFEIVALSRVGTEHMHENIAVVYHNPFGIGISVVIVGFYMPVFKQPLCRQWR